jgi:hypothetical protein
MVDSTLHPSQSQSASEPQLEALRQASSLELAQALAEKLAIASDDWHRLKSNRKARSQEQVASALVYLLNDQPDTAIAHLQQAVGWLDRSISAPPCPTHGHTHGHGKDGHHQTENNGK